MLAHVYCILCSPYSLYESFVPPLSVTRSTWHGSTYINVRANISASHNSFTLETPKIWNDYRIKLNDLKLIYKFIINGYMTIELPHYLLSFAENSSGQARRTVQL